MNRITLWYSTHRPETLVGTARILKGHDVINLEDPLYPDFHKALGGDVERKEHLLELDTAYRVLPWGNTNCSSNSPGWKKDIAGRAISGPFVVYNVRPLCQLTLVQ